MAGMAERAGIAWRRLLRLGLGVSRPELASGSLICSSEAPIVGKVVIRWNLVLEAAVEAIGGTEPAYARKKFDGLFRARVSFRIPLDKAQSVFRNVEVAGMGCLEVWEAESTAAAQALDELEREPFHVKILDVSRLHCEKMERDCNRSLYEEVVGNMRRGSDGVYGKIAFDAANCIYELQKTSYLKHTELIAELEKIRAAEWDIDVRVAHHFCGRCHSRPQTQPGDLPSEIKVCMKVVLDEMIKSLGLDEPAFNFSPAKTGLHACEVLLLLKHNHASSCRKTPAIVTAKASSQHEALEASCQRVTFLLEDKMSTHLLDMNYNKRLEAEPYILEAKELANLAISISAKIIAEWEALVDKLQSCAKQCSNAVAHHMEKQLWNQRYNPKCECALDLSDLHEACLSDLVLAKDRHALLAKWTSK